MNPIHAEELFAAKGAVQLAVSRKRPAAGESLGVLVLVHGSSLGARPSFDLHVPGKPEYSMMDWFASRGYDVWAMDHEGYGKSTITSANSDIACGVEDLRALMRLIARHTGRRSVLLYGMSSGALRAASFAASDPHAVERLALDAFVWTGAGSPTLKQRMEGLAYFRQNARRPIDRKSVESIFTRDQPGLFEPEAAIACADAQLAYGDSVPTGTYLDMTAHLPVVDPAAVQAPTLIIRPQFDGIATVDDLLAFFARLPSPDKQFAVIPDTTHASIFGIHRRRIWRCLHAFLSTDGSRTPR